MNGIRIEVDAKTLARIASENRGVRTVFDGLIDNNLRRVHNNSVFQDLKRALDGTANQGVVGVIATYPDREFSELLRKAVLQYADETGIVVSEGKMRK